MPVLPGYWRRGRGQGGGYAVDEDKVVALDVVGSAVATAAATVAGGSTRVRHTDPVTESFRKWVLVDLELGDLHVLVG